MIVVNELRRGLKKVNELFRAMDQIRVKGMHTSKKKRTYTTIILKQINALIGNLPLRPECYSRLRCHRNDSESVL